MGQSGQEQYVWCHAVVVSRFVLASRLCVMVPRSVGFGMVHNGIVPRLEVRAC